MIGVSVCRYWYLGIGVEEDEKGRIVEKESLGENGGGGYGFGGMRLGINGGIDGERMEERKV